MARLVTTVASVAAIALAASVGTAAAECYGAHKDVTASISQPQEGAAMSTYDGKLQPLAEQPEGEKKVAEAPQTDGDRATADQDRK